MKTLLVLAGILLAPLAAVAEVITPTPPSPISFGRIERALHLTAEQRPTVKEIWDRYAPELHRLETGRFNQVAAAHEVIGNAFTHMMRPAMTASDVEIRPADAVKTARDKADPDGSIRKASREKVVALLAEISATDRAIKEKSDGLEAAISPLLTAAQVRDLQSFNEALAAERSAWAKLAMLASWGRRSMMVPAFDAVARARAGLLDPWSLSWKKKDMAGFRALLASGYETDSWSAFGKGPSDELFQVSRLVGAATVKGNEAADDAGALLRRFGAIDDVRITVLDAGTAPYSTLKGRIVVRGADAATKRRLEFAAEIEIGIDDKNGRQLLRTTRLSGGTLVAAVRDEALFADRTREAGLDAVPTYIRNEAIRRGGYALALADYNGDACADMFVGTEGPGLLLDGDCKGHFKDVTARSGLGKDILTKAAVFADFNNDGRQDLLMVNFEYSASKQISLYEGMPNSKFRPAKNFDFKNFGKYEYKLPMPIAVGDFDADAKLDFYVGFPGKMDFTTLAHEESARTDGGRSAGLPQGLFMNAGEFAFADKTDYGLYGIPDFAQRMKTHSLYPHSAVAFDMNDDGRQDILVVDDRKNLAPVFRNKGGGAFEQVAQSIGIDHPQWGMSAAVGDYDNDGRPDLYITNVNFPGSFIQGWKGQRGTEGNRLYRNAGDGTFQEATPAVLRYAGDAPGGASVGGVDNDRRHDILVVNGLWTGAGRTDFADTFQSAIAAIPSAQLLEEFGYTSVLFGGERPIEKFMGKGQASMDILKHARDSEGRPLFSLAGSQGPRLYHNNGDGTFVDVAYVAGFESTSDGYVAATADVYADGGQDFILRNADPGTPEHVFPTLQLIKNNAGRGRAHLGLQLTGVKSSRDAIGAQAAVVGRDGLKQYRELIANNGAAQDEKVLHFGLGKEDGVKNLEVRWPSGLKQNFGDVLAGDYQLKEGGTLERIVRGTRTAQH